MRTSTTGSLDGSQVSKTLGKTVKNRVKERKKGGRIEDHPVAGETVFYGVTATQAGGRA